MIETSKQGAVGIVTLDRPGARNALNVAMVELLIESLAAFYMDPVIRVIILTGTDPSFCVGLDFKDFEATYRVLQRGSTSLRRGLLGPTEKPVNGSAVTGGLELALDCDWIIASRESASFADTHARVGVMPAGGMTIRLPQLIGVNRARQMSFTGEFINATVAYEWGLVNELCEHSQLLPRAIEIAQSIAEIEPAAIRELRSMYAELSLLHDDRAYIEESIRSQRWIEDHFELENFDRQSVIRRVSEQQKNASS